ncbi:MAG TPA: hypothetical protein VF184_07240 [Phycisphaeraceae bacterium]
MDDHNGLLQKIETWAIVTVISVLIWLYAEGEAVTRYSERVPIRLVPPVGRQLAIDIPGRDGGEASEVIYVTFKASTGQLTKIKERLQQGPLQIEVADQPGEQVLVLKDELLETPLGQLGVNIVTTDPATLTVQVEPLQTLTMPVGVDRGQVLLAQPALVEPREVSVTLPARLLEQARGMKVWAPLDLAELGRLEPGVPQTFDVPLSVPEELQTPWTDLEPDVARVTVTISKQTDTYVVPRISVEVQASPLVLRRFDLNISDEYLNLLEVPITGPADVIDRIRKGQLSISAVVRPTLSELESGTRTLPVQLNLPPGVTVQAPLPPVPVEVTPHSAASSTQGG